MNHDDYQRIKNGFNQALEQGWEGVPLSGDALWVAEISPSVAKDIQQAYDRSREERIQRDKKSNS